MPSLKDLRNRIDSVKSTRKITKAMQLVAAAKLRKAQDAAVAAGPYAKRMAGVLANLAASAKDSPDAPPLLQGTGKEDVHLLIVATADRGLCGGFNGSIVRLARERIVSLQSAGKTVKIMTLGKKGYDLLNRLYHDKIVHRMDLRAEKTLDSALAGRISEKVLEMFEAGEFDVAHLIYADFKSILSQTPTERTLIPAKDAIDLDAETPDLKGAVYEYEPSEEAILETLLPRYLNTQLLNALLQNAAGEQGARMTAMDNATRNAGDMINSLSLQYNRARQAQITKELIEIISGAEAL